jgi:hypothetical protein
VQHGIPSDVSLCLKIVFYCRETVTLRAILIGVVGRSLRRSAASD